MTGLFGRGLRTVPDSTFWATRGKRENMEIQELEKTNKDDLRQVFGLGITPGQVNGDFSAFINT